MDQREDGSASGVPALAAEWPSPRDEAGADVAVTYLLIVRDVARARRFYTEVFDAPVLMEGPPTILRFFNTWLVLAEQGGPTDDKPDVVATAPADSRTLTSALNLRVANIHAVYERWRARGAEFLTPPQTHEAEIRCYMRDLDGHLIEVGQTTRVPGA